MVQDERYFDDVTLTLEETGDSLLDQARSRAGPLFKWVACRVLLGRDTAEAAPLFEKQLADFSWGRGTDRDIGAWAILTGAAVLLNRAPEKLAETLLDRLPLYAALPETDYQIAQSVLSLSMLARNDSLVARWTKACFRVRPDSAAPYTFGLLALTTLAPDGTSSDLDVLADVTARVIDASLSSAPFYSGAPHVCMLQALAVKNGTSAASLLHERLRRLDDLMFGSGSKPKVTLGPTTTAYAHEAGGGAALEITVKAKGQGQLLVGPYDIPPFTHGLHTVIAAAIERADRSHIAHRTAQQALRDQALLRPGGICRGVLDVFPGVEIPTEHVRLLKEQFMLGFEIAKHHIDGMVARPELMVRRKSHKSRTTKRAD